ncbi:hypothetical protein, partial [Escherichia coli]|uniref:hypothetical protein n=1 Tax=Escherichia coli TaxID=562 RepID=UPI0025414A8B
MAPLEIRHRSVRPISAKHAQASRFLQQSQSALALASACSYLLKEETPDESIRAEVFSYIPRQKLA